ncbi:MAG: MBOAT family protein, partial [Desulfovibrionaceae bacterium]|nr:MBOAT family protein [Desulfovibrionaceae bacterium]
MSFNSLQYLLFFLSVLGLFQALPQRLRGPMLLAASYVFYASWNAKYALLMLVTTLSAWLAGRGMAKASPAGRRAWLAAVCLLNFGILALFKYHTLIASTLNAVSKALTESAPFAPLDVLLPVGISFYTFQAISYVADVCRDPKQCEPRLLPFALYISFFPQLVAGPIERAHHILPQLHGRLTFDFEHFCQGCMLIVFGLFKKLVIADRLAAYVNLVYAAPGNCSPIQAWLAVYFFAFQIYCDFSGYTDIARGSARILGVELMENFRQPYFARSIQDFWRRWHISLSTWFRDYVYIPMGGSRGSRTRTLINILVVFAVCGLWHGAAWTFVAWGLAHALLLCGQVALTRLFPARTPQPPSRLLELAKIVLVFHLTALAWILFRAEDFGQAATMFHKVLALRPGDFLVQGTSGLSAVKAFLLSLSPSDSLAVYEVMLSLGFVGLMIVLDAAIRRAGFLEAWSSLAR